jgi:hypothetical protein
MRTRQPVPPPPGEESAGPALSILIEQTQLTRVALEHLVQEARWKAMARFSSITVPFATDASGNATVSLFDVPQDHQASLVLLSVDEAAVTPQAPDTRATLSITLYAGLPGIGALLDCIPQTPGVPAQIPCSFNYGAELTAPRLYGPTPFVLRVSNANASKQCAARLGLWVVRSDQVR